MAVSKVAISLPPELLRLIDFECRARGINRSEFFRWAVSDLFRRRAERAADAEYEEAYRKHPEDPAESEAYLAIAAAAVGSLPWDE
jgi:metal-responsive CopG/Arc/MetJ family transcriptional regulator